MYFNLIIKGYTVVLDLSHFKGIMLVYDITNAKSFDNIAKWLRNIGELKVVL